ncbi:MAG: AAA family ATPase [Methanobrevibacter sp.]|nr:AAA family ATPase [Methanobrevibacter sp.]
MKVIGVTGLPGSGKSILFDTAMEKGAIVVSMGDIVREKAAERGEDSGTTARTLREEFGQYIVAELTIEKIKGMLEEQTDEKIILVDGIRSPYEIELFKENFDNFVSVSIYASPQTRYERLVLRNREDDPKVYDDFLVRDNREIGFGIAEVVATADYMLNNECTLDEFKQSVAEFIEKEID